MIVQVVKDGTKWRANLKEYYESNPKIIATTKLCSSKESAVGMLILNNHKLFDFLVTVQEPTR